ncbi:MAG: 2,3-bisphosphoglycerate-independent phosphoglycerate mutase [Dehalococcoidales bacterium]|nr:2,3-bisphosphoglycerate-independent phosphoglycerate mutase [Dehalococcoidales bacterium]
MELIRGIARPSPSKIVLLVIDGLGGLPDPNTGKTELETASTPYLDELAAHGMCGLTDPVSPGITPGSAPGHLALFGYDPIRFNIGRGVLEAVGIDFDLQPGDVAARGNFCSIDANGLITDRRAGRISTDKCTELCRLLDGQTFDNVKVLVQPVREHRFVAVFRGAGLAANVSESDPQQAGAAPLTITPVSTESARMANVANQFAAQARTILAGHHPANMVLLRGFSSHPDLPSMADIYKIKPAAIAVYPMYRGLAKLVGMDALKTGTSVEDEFRTVKTNYAGYDFFFVHIKGTDSAGEDGDFARKVKVIEQVDRALPLLLDLKPDVIVVTGDHSTPAVLKGHSWHPVPALIYSQWCRHGQVTKFGETACLSGSMGRIPAAQLMPLAMANALKLNKYGA